jgi:hypothetical protein
MKTVALLAVAAALLPQALPPSPRELLIAERPLTAREIASVLAASRAALADKTIRVSSLSGNRVAEIRMGPAARPMIVRTTGGVEGGIVSGTISRDSRAQAKSFWHDGITRIIDYTGRQARSCDGSFEPGQVVVVYEQRASTREWTATARRRDARDALGVSGAFAMLDDMRTMTGGERRLIAGRQARAFLSPWIPPTPDRFGGGPLRTGDPAPNVAGDPASHDATQSLWIDTASLLPVRWERSDNGVPVEQLDFTLVPIDLRAPTGVVPPDCVR